jgi:hypothetical protein
VAVAMAELLRNSDAYTWSTSTSSTTFVSGFRRSSGAR